ncbi:hypothetical protein B0H10DRAFT_1969818 [Mycena sp. CBHHK59/15]|nr:hypothetical protein B0H10DRAFT_1969818 [Mycena sp. CBHHK59/15]
MWNPDLCEELALTDEKLQWNEQPIETDHTMVFDPNFTLSHMEKGFRIFAFEESLNGISARKISGPSPGLMTVILHAQVLRPEEFDQSVNVMVTTETEDARESEILSLTFDNPEIPLSFTSALSGDFLLQAQVKDREKFENNMLDAKFHLLKAVFAMLNERVADSLPVD